MNVMHMAIQDRAVKAYEACLTHFTALEPVLKELEKQLPEFDAGYVNEHAADEDPFVKGLTTWLAISLADTLDRGRRENREKIARDAVWQTCLYLGRDDQRAYFGMTAFGWQEMAEDVFANMD